MLLNSNFGKLNCVLRLIGPDSINRFPNLLALLVLHPVQLLLRLPDLLSIELQIALLGSNYKSRFSTIITTQQQIIMTSFDAVRGLFEFLQALL